MGLDTSHDCWHGAYSAFMRWRRYLAKTAGLPPLMLMEAFYAPGGYGDPFGMIDHHLPKDPELSARVQLREIREELPISWEPFKDDVLTVLLHHSDCDGSIAHEHTEKLAKRLEGLAGKMPPGEDGGGHIGLFRVKTLQLAKGLREAHEAGEDVEFY